MADRRRAWPGWDGWVLIALGVGTVALWLAKGRPAGGDQVALLVALDVAALMMTRRTRA